MYNVQIRPLDQTKTALSYDANGALLGLPSGLSLSYNAEGDLSAVSSNGTAIVENWYDAAGRRIAKRENGVLTLYLWVGMEVVAAADAEPEHLYEAGDGRFEFDRTISRLMEMRSDDYLAEGHGER